MILIGRYLSPFVRRVAVTLHHHGIEFEHRPIRAAGEEQDVIRKSNPLGRVPVLILDDGTVLADSAVILEYLDDRAGPERTLTPGTGAQRYRLLSNLGIATGAAEKAIAVFSERMRPQEKQHEPYVAGCARQAKDGFEYLDRAALGPWMDGERMTQLDVSLVCYYEFVRAGVAELFDQLDCPNVAAMAERAGALAEFRAAPI